MRNNKLSDAINYIDYDLIMEADIKTTKTQTATIIKLRLALASACAMLACMLLIAVPFLSIDGTQSGVTPIPTPSSTSDPTTTHTHTTDIITPDTWDTPTPPPSSVPTEVDYIAHLTLDVNPSIDITVENGIVTAYRGINDEGEELVGTITVNGLEIKIALPIILDTFIEKGYLSRKNTGVILISVYGSENSTELLKLAEEITSEVIAKNRLTTYIISQKLKYSIDVEKIAKAYGISLGKMQYIINLYEKSSSFSFDSFSEAASLPLSTLLRSDIDESFSYYYTISDGYNQYGEKILMVKLADDISIYIVWDELSKEDQKEIYELYKPSFYTDIEK